MLGSKHHSDPHPSLFSPQHAMVVRPPSTTIDDGGGNDTSPDKTPKGGRTSFGTLPAPLSFESCEGPRPQRPTGGEAYPTQNSFMVMFQLKGKGKMREKVGLFSGVEEEEEERRKHNMSLGRAGIGNNNKPPPREIGIIEGGNPPIKLNTS